jgi:hypothetical protein
MRETTNNIAWVTSVSTTREVTLGINLVNIDLVSPVLTQIA